MDFGDWQELARLRAENHCWHRCIAEIMEAIRKPMATSQSMVESISVSIASLNDALARLRRRPVTLQR
jgi:hypothetical protein